MANDTLQRIDGSGLRFLLAGETEQPRSLVFLLHGSGSHSGNLLPGAALYGPRLPGAMFVIPDAPQSWTAVLSLDEVEATTRANPGMDWDKSLTWVGRRSASTKEKDAGLTSFHDVVRPPVRALSRLADLLLARHGLTDSALAFYGFSQGGMVAVHVAVDRPAPCAGVVCHSGHFLGWPEARSRPPVLLLVGSKEIEPTMAMSQVYPITLKALRDLQVPLEEHVCQGLGHANNDETVRRTCDFLRASLGIR